MWKLKRGTSLFGVWRLERVAVPLLNCRKNCQLPTQQKKNGEQEGIINHRPQQERRYIAAPTRNWQPLQFSQWETAITLNSCFFSKGLSFIIILPNFFFLLHKIKLFSFVCWTCLGLWCRLLVLNCNSLIFPNKPIFFAGKITDSLIFKDNR